MKQTALRAAADAGRETHLNNHMLEDLERRLTDLPEEELLRIATTDRAEYVPEALALVDSELKRRGIAEVSRERHRELKHQRESSETSRLPRWLAWIYPAISSEVSALRVARHGAVAAWVVSGTTVVLSLLAG